MCMCVFTRAAGVWISYCILHWRVFLQRHIINKRCFLALSEYNVIMMYLIVLFSILMIVIKIVRAA